MLIIKLFMGGMVVLSSFAQAQEEKIRGDVEDSGLVPYTSFRGIKESGKKYSPKRRGLWSSPRIFPSSPKLPFLNSSLLGRSKIPKFLKMAYTTSPLLTHVPRSMGGVFDFPRNSATTNFLKTETDSCLCYLALPKDLPHLEESPRRGKRVVCLVPHEYFPSSSQEEKDKKDRLIEIQTKERTPHYSYWYEKFTNSIHLHPDKYSARKISPEFREKVLDKVCTHLIEGTEEMLMHPSLSWRSGQEEQNFHCSYPSPNMEKLKIDASLLFPLPRHDSLLGIFNFFNTTPLSPPYWEPEKIKNALEVLQVIRNSPPQMKGFFTPIEYEGGMPTIKRILKALEAGDRERILRDLDHLSSGKEDLSIHQFNHYLPHALSLPYSLFLEDVHKNEGAARNSFQLTENIKTYEAIIQFLVQKDMVTPSKKSTYLGTPLEHLYKIYRFKGEFIKASQVASQAIDLLRSPELEAFEAMVEAQSISLPS
jgi:hypothetical protein